MRNKYKGIIFALLIGAFLLLSGCSTGISSAKQDAFSIGSGTSSNGGSGVNLEFAQGNPPSQMNKAQPVNFGFVFKNFQRQDITDMRLRIEGIEWGYVSGLQKEYNIQKIPKANPQAGPGVYSGLVVQGVSVDGFVGQYNFNPHFDYCYSAKTTFREQICVPSKLNQCNLKVDNSISQNGPLSITVNRINSVGNNVRLYFSVSNSGNGKVVNTCFKTDDYSNAYTLSDVKLGSTSGNCKAISGYNIIGGKSNFYCDFPRSGTDAYASQIVVTLDYKYQQSTEKKIVVSDPNQGYN